MQMRQVLFAVGLPHKGEVFGLPQKGGSVTCRCYKYYAQVLLAYYPQVFRLLASSRCFRLLAVAGVIGY
jgi:hypothetical protein